MRIDNFLGPPTNDQSDCFSNFSYTPWREVTKFEKRQSIRKAYPKFRSEQPNLLENSLFKDFYQMTEYETHKAKFLYLLGTAHGEKFFNGGRTLSSVLSRDEKLRKDFNDKFGDRYRTVCDYYLPRKGLVVIQDVSAFVPELVAAVESGEAEEE